MLEKKETIQKTFRLDSKINGNLEKLSEILERTQNDLVNIAIQNLLEENQKWLAKNIFLDYASDFFSGLKDETNFEIDMVSINLKYIDKNRIKLKVIVKDDEKIYEEYESEYDAIKKEDNIRLEKDLRDLFQNINPDCEQVKNYLKQVNNYK